MISAELIALLMEDGLEQFGLFYSSYEAQVSDNQDPDKRGRLKVICPAVYGDAVSDWALPKGMFSGNKIGFFALPQIGDPVWLSCRKGDPKIPIWEYGAYAKDYAPDGADYKHFVYRTPKGYMLTVDEENDSAVLTTPAGLLLNLNEKDNEVLLKKAEKDYIRIKTKISIYANGENLFNTLDKLLTALLTPMNLTTPSGPGQFNPKAVKDLTEVKLLIAKLLE